MKVVIGDMTVSTGGVLRLNKSLLQIVDIRPGDRIIMMQDDNNSKVSIQIQRGNEVIFLLSDAEPIFPQRT